MPNRTINSTRTRRQVAKLLSVGVVLIIQTVGESGKVLVFVNATRARIEKGNINYNIVSYHDPTPFQLAHVPQLQDSVRKWSFENSSVFSEKPHT